MKALIIAEHAAAAAELVAGARTMADEVVAISFGGAYECGADKVLNITVPEGLTVDSAVETVNAAFDAENPEVVLVEACRHMKVIAGSLAFHADTAVITDVTAFEAEGAKSMYFGGIAERAEGRWQRCHLHHRRWRVRRRRGCQRLRCRAGVGCPQLAR